MLLGVGEAYDEIKRRPARAWPDVLVFSEVLVFVKRVARSTGKFTGITETTDK